PNTAYTGFNVAGANVLEGNIYAENGIMHLIDKVIEPLPNAEQKMATNDEYEEFRNLMEVHLTSYFTHPEVTGRFSILSGTAEPVYVKSYNPALIFSPNSENWQDPETGVFYTNESQANTNTLFVPTNAAVKDYVKNVLLQYYPDNENVSQLPQNIIAD